MKNLRRCPSPLPKKRQTPSGWVTVRVSRAYDGLFSVRLEGPNAHAWLLLAEPYLRPDGNEALK